MCVYESNSFVRHFLQVRGLDLAVRVRRGDIPDSEIVREDENDVGVLVVFGMKKTAQENQRE
jgi:hypothetical protein